MKPWLFVGAKVVCVASKWSHVGRWNWRWLERAPKSKRTYIVSAVGYTDATGDVLMVHIKGFKRAYSANAFKPLIDTTSQVTAMRELMQKARDEKRVTVVA